MRGKVKSTFLELVSALASQQTLEGILGLTVRDGDIVRVNPDRSRINQLDALPYPVRNGKLMS